MFIGTTQAAKRSKGRRLPLLLAAAATLWFAGASVYMDALRRGHLGHGIESQHLDDCYRGHNHDVCAVAATSRAVPADSGSVLQEPSVASVTLGGGPDPVVSRPATYRPLPRSPPSLLS